jgi:uncharacterized cupin superfamily protein
MFPRRYVSFIFAFFVMFSVAFANTGTVEKVKGKVEINGIPVNEGAIVTSGARISTFPDSEAMVRFSDGQVLGLKAGTTMTVDDYHFNEKTPTTGRSLFTLIKGGLRALSGLLAKVAPQRVGYRFASGTIGVRGTEIMLAMANNTSFMNVVSGSIQITTTAGTTTTLVAGQTIAVAASGTVVATGSAAAALATQAGAFSGLNTMSLSVTAAGTGGAAGASGTAGTTATSAAGTTAASTAGTTAAGAAGTTAAGAAGTAAAAGAGVAGAGALAVGVIPATVAAGIAGVVAVTSSTNSTTTHSTPTHNQ